MIPSHCTAHHKCWECFQGWQARVLTRDINLAISLTTLRAATVTNYAESISSLREAAWLLQQLHNTQWREMVRPAFIFTTLLEKKPAVKTLSINDLDLDL